MEKKTCYGYEDGRLGFPGGANVSRSVEMVGCCLFSNSRSFTACFLQIMLHKQAWLTWYLRKLNNSGAHGSLQKGNKFCDCAARLFVFWFSCSARMSSRVCRRGKHGRQFHVGAQLDDQQHDCGGNYVLECKKWCASQCGGFRGQTIDVILSNCVSMLYLCSSTLFFLLFRLGSSWSSAAWSSPCSQPFQLIRTSPPTVCSSW